MQVNPKIQYNEDDAGLTLDNPIVEPVAESVDKVESINSQDEADLIAAESEHKEIIIEKSQKTSSIFESHKNDRLFTFSYVATAVLSVIGVYFAVSLSVFI